MQLRTLLNLLVAHDPPILTARPLTSSAASQRTPVTSSTPDSQLLIEDAPATRGGPAILFDSAPGTVSVDQVSRVLAGGGGGNNLLRILCLPPATFIFTLLKILELRIQIASLGRGLGPYEQMLSDLKNPKLFPSYAPRLYVYSTCDTIVTARNVETHLKEVKEEGVWFATRKNAIARHVCTMSLYPEPYWADVRALWEGGLKREMGIGYATAKL